MGTLAFLYSLVATLIWPRRQAMAGTNAWKRHGCFKLGSEQYFNMPLEKSLLGCYDDWNALDHFDPTANSRRMFGHFNYLRTYYGALQDGFNLVQRGNWTYWIERPGSNNTGTEMGLWSVSRAGIDNVQTLSGANNNQVWLFYTNENATKTWNFPCDGDDWISSPYQGGTKIKNLFAPYETYTLSDSKSAFFNDSKAPFFGCLPEFTIEGYGFKALVPETDWTTPLPALTKFIPGHDHRIMNDGSGTANVDIVFEFNQVMTCDSVTQAITLEMASSGHGSAPTLGAATCGAVAKADPSRISGDPQSAWQWAASIQNMPDGILRIHLNNPKADGATANSTNVSTSTPVF